MLRTLDDENHPDRTGKPQDKNKNKTRNKNNNCQCGDGTRTPFKKKKGNALAGGNAGQCNFPRTHTAYCKA